MTTPSTLVLCILLGQVNGGSQFGTAIPVPQSSARRTVETSPAMPSSRFGAPTPADPRSVLAAPQASDLNVAVGSSANLNANENAAPRAPNNFNPPASTQGFQPVSRRGIAEQPRADSPAKRLIQQSFPSSDDVGDQTATLALSEVIAATGDRGRRMSAIQTYWEASTLLADWQFGAEEFDLLRQVSAPQDPASQAVLRAAQSAAQARYIEAQMAANSARHALVDLVPALQGDGKGAPPMPIDAPLAGKYNTQFETIFAARLAPAGLRRIHETLPLRQDLVDARATAVFAAGEAVEQQIGAYQNGRASLADLLKEFENLRTQRGAFLGALRDYNLEIAEYALGISQPNDSADKVVGMMIESPAGAVNVAETGTSRSVLVAPAGSTSPTTIIRSDVPLGSTQPPAQPTTAQPPVRFADQTSGAATALPRPPTERVLGTLRDVTHQPAAETFQPSANFGARVGATISAGGSQDSSNSGNTQIVVPAENAPGLPPLTP